MPQLWKAFPLSKGLLTWVPALDAWRRRHAITGGTDTPRYCYSVWLRHLVMLHRYGFKTTGARIGELGPGDSIGIGLAALLSGANQYVGLDIVPFSAKADLESILEELIQLYSRRAPIPDQDEFPSVRPRLESYKFPGHLIEWGNFSFRTENVRAVLRAGFIGSDFLQYKAPWTSSNEIAMASLDLIFSQAVLEHVDDLDETYKAMSLWLTPGGYASHVIDFTSHGLSPFWNGHWAYSDFEWRLVRGRREFLLNREPLSTHLACIKKVGLELVFLEQNSQRNHLNRQDLSGQFRALDADDLRTSGVVMILRKPLSNATALD